MTEKQQEEEDYTCPYCNKTYNNVKDYDDCVYRHRMIRLIASLGC